MMAEKQQKAASLITKSPNYLMTSLQCAAFPMLLSMNLLELSNAQNLKPIEE